MLSLTPDGRIALNAAACRVLLSSDVKFVLLLWDRINRKIALKATTKADRNGYAVTIVPSRHAGGIRAKSFLTHIGWKGGSRLRLAASWNHKEKMLEVIVPQTAVSSIMRERKSASRA